MFFGDESFLPCHFAGEDELPSSSSQTRTTPRITEGLCTRAAPTQKLSFRHTSGRAASGMRFHKVLKGSCSGPCPVPEETPFSLPSPWPSCLNLGGDPGPCSPAHFAAATPGGPRPLGRTHGATWGAVHSFALQQPPQRTNTFLSLASFTKSLRFLHLQGAVAQQHSAVTLGLPTGDKEEP